MQIYIRHVRNHIGLFTEQQVVDEVVVGHVPAAAKICSAATNQATAGKEYLIRLSSFCGSSSAGGSQSKRSCLPVRNMPRQLRPLSQALVRPEQ